MDLFLTKSELKVKNFKLIFAPFEYAWIVIKIIKKIEAYPLSVWYCVIKNEKISDKLVIQKLTNPIPIPSLTNNFKS